MLEEIVAAGRKAAAGVMRDTCVIRRGAAGQVYNPATDTYTTPAGQVLYSGPCRVKPRGLTDQEVEAGAETVSLFAYVVSVPVSAVTYEVNDVVTVTASALDPALAGLRLRVRAPNYGSQITARRLGCEVQT